jgi:hypothetical protein
MGEFLEGLVDVAAYLVPIVLFVWVVRYLIEMARERRKLRLEVSKLAHELEGLRGDHRRHAGESSG